MERPPEQEPKEADVVTHRMEAGLPVVTGDDDENMGSGTCAVQVVRSVGYVIL